MATDVLSVFWIVCGISIAYLVASVGFTYLVQQFPRRPVVDPPDWGHIEDLRLPSVEPESAIEVWRVVPDTKPIRGTVVLAHGWGRNRDRMTGRARLFAGWGFTTIMHSSRDHGGSTRRACMNAYRFAEDIGALLDWVKTPVILYGHSAGAGGAIVAAQHRQKQVQALILEGCYPYTRPALRRLYHWFHPLFGAVFGGAIVFWLNLFYRGAPDRFSPARMAPGITVPVLLIHGQRDRRFPVSFAKTLLGAFTNGNAELFIAPEAGHSDSSKAAAYPEAVAGFLSRSGWPDVTDIQK